jgi:predicted metal-dependent HD superfamily phosphohydrolase
VNYEKLLDQVKKFVVAFYKNHHDERFTYHNLEHTEDVVKAAIQICGHYQLDDKDYFTVITAAWFHDIGYRGDDMSNHEEKSALIAADFLKDLRLPEEVLNNITTCILATKMPQSPDNILESIVCDADLFHFGTDDFLNKSRLLRREMNNLYNTKINKKDWRQKTLRIMTEHEYHTDYCKLLLNDKKQDNIRKLTKPDKANAKESDVTVPEIRNEEPATIFQDEKNKDRILKGVDTMFKITSNNHQRLSNMADSKAHIMISVNAIIISLLISLLLRQIEKYHNEAIPAVMLLVVNLVTIVFAILATRPNIPKGTFTKEEVEQKKVNLLFFGNFFRMNLDDYTAGMVKMMNDKEFLYDSLIRDLYGQGIVLGRKYRLLRVSYNVFMFGLVLSVIAFVIAALR